MRIAPTKSGFSSYVPPGFSEEHEYLEILNTKKNVAANVVAFCRARDRRVFLSVPGFGFGSRSRKSSTEDKREDDSELGSDRRLKKLIFSGEKPAKDRSALEEVEGMPEQKLGELEDDEMKELAAKEQAQDKSSVETHHGLSSKMVADTIVFSFPQKMQYRNRLRHA